MQRKKVGGRAKGAEVDQEGGKVGRGRRVKS